MKRKLILSLAMVGCLLGVFTVSAIAELEFTFNFEPPFPNSMKSKGPAEITKRDAAYVNPSHSATPTNYFLSPKKESSQQATEILTDISTKGKRSFTYLDGYGGIGTEVYLSAYPTYWDFVEYKVEGTWSP